MAERPQLAVSLHLAEDLTNPVAADAGAEAFELADAEAALLAVDGLADELGLSAKGLDGRADALLELDVGGLEDAEEVVDEPPRIVRTLVPALGAVFEGLVVAILVLFDEALEADVPADLGAGVVGEQERQQARDAAVAVAEGVDAEEVEREGGRRDERVDGVVADGGAPQGGELGERPARWAGRPRRA